MTSYFFFFCIIGFFSLPCLLCLPDSTCRFWRILPLRDFFVDFNTVTLWLFFCTCFSLFCLWQCNPVMVNSAKEEGFCHTLVSRGIHSRCTTDAVQPGTRGCKLRSSCKLWPDEPDHVPLWLCDSSVIWFHYARVSSSFLTWFCSVVRTQSTPSREVQWHPRNMPLLFDSFR